MNFFIPIRILRSSTPLAVPYGRIGWHPRAQAALRCFIWTTVALLLLQPAVFAQDEPPRFYPLPWPVNPPPPQHPNTNAASGFPFDVPLFTLGVSTRTTTWRINNEPASSGFQAGIIVLNYERGVGAQNWTETKNHGRWQPDYPLTSMCVASTNLDTVVFTWGWLGDGLVGPSRWRGWTNTAINIISPDFVLPYVTTNLTTSDTESQALSTYGANIQAEVTGGFSAPNGTGGWTNSDGSYVSDSYSSTLALSTPGVIGSTNEHFYRVQLSLEYADHTPLSTYYVNSFLGQQPDAAGNVYVWLQDATIYRPSPSFTTPEPPSFYSYNAEMVQAQQLGTLMVSTIQDGGDSWPGNAPTGIYKRLGYPTNTFDPSGDQIAFDILLNTPVSAIFNAGIAIILLTRAIPVDYEKDMSRGDISGLTEEDRKYITMVFLKRSSNPDPEDFMTYNELDEYMSFTNRFGWRLINEFSIEACAYDSKFGHSVAGKNVQRRQSKIGNTRLKLTEPVDLRLIIYPSIPALSFPVTITLDEGWVNPIITGMGTVFENDPGGGHDLMIGGAKGSLSIYNICAGRAGWLLRQVETPLLRRTPPDFSSWIIYRADGDAVTRRRRLSAWTNDVIELNTERTWPSGFEFHYDWDLQFYEKKKTHSQMSTPFDGFLTLGP